MWPNPQEITDLVTFTEETLMENFIFCSVVAYFLRKIQTSWVNNSKIRRIKNAEFWWYCFMWTRTYSEIFKSALVYLS